MIDYGIRIRRAHDDELDELADMDRVCFPHDDPPPLDAPTWWVAAAHHGSRPPELCAYAGAYRSSFVVPDAVYLSRIGVLPEARGLRVSERLISAVVRWARTQGSVIITDTNNPASANAHIRCGFRLFEPPWRWALSDSIYLRRLLPHGSAAKIAHP